MFCGRGAHDTAHGSSWGKEEHVCRLVMEGCSAVEYCAAGAKLGESLKHVAFVLLKGKTCFFLLLV